MKKLSIHLLGLSVALAAAGCGKDDPTPDNVSAKTKLLTAPKWRIAALVGTTTLAGQTTSFDGMVRVPDCKKDDFTQFKTDLTAIQDEGATKCSTADPQSKSGTWSFNADETQLTIIDPSVPVGSRGNTVTGDVLQLTATTLQVKTTTTQTIAGYTVVSTATTTYAPI